MMRLPRLADQLSLDPMETSLPSLAKLARRGLFAGLLAGTVGALSFASIAGAQNIAGFNSNQPVNYAADRIE
ncbi:MAG TPA: hypothetical protein VLA45_06070, partial [Paracoccaceae bacterium]|nr:hypothetical protein [Paracoccaceae bacterium]